MTVVSAAAHAALIAALLVAPRGWLSSAQQAPQATMTISLGGGTPGPTTGLTSIGGRAVQAETPPELQARRQPLSAPAARTPEMTVPRTLTPSRPSTAPPVREAPPEARGRTPTRGAETSPGTAVAETGARGQGFGLSSGGGAGSGSRLDVADFCCPDYLVLMLERIRSNWNQRAEVAGQTTVVFTIQRDGRITDVSVEKPSGYFALDINAQRALVSTRQLPPLPAEFTNPTLTVHLNFEYRR
jgi:TonB family protein